MKEQEWNEWVEALKESRALADFACVRLGQGEQSFVLASIDPALTHEWERVILAIAKIPDLAAGRIEEYGPSIGLLEEHFTIKQLQRIEIKFIKEFLIVKVKKEGLDFPKITRKIVREILKKESQNVRIYLKTLPPWTISRIVTALIEDSRDKMGSVIPDDPDLREIFAYYEKGDV